MFFFNRKKVPVDWPSVASQIASTLLELMQRDMTSLAKQYARFVLSKDGSVAVYFDERPPQYVLGLGDIACVFIREDSAALSQWVKELKEATGAPDFQVIATETFARKLVRELMKQGEAGG